MSQYEDRRSVLRDAIDGATTALGELSEESRAPFPAEAAARLEKVLAFARSSLEATDPEFISEASYSQLHVAVSLISSNVGAALESSAQHTDAVLAAVSLLPATNGRNIEQVVAEIASAVHRPIDRRVTALDEDIRRAEGALAGVQQEISAASGAVEVQITAQTAEFQAQLSARAVEFQGEFQKIAENVSAQRQALDELRASQSEAFAQSQGERATQFQEQDADFRKQLGEAKERARSMIGVEVAEIRRMAEESGALVGAIAQGATAERFGDEANAQKKVADWLRWSTVLLAFGAFGVAVYAAAAHENTSQAVASKIAVAVILGGLAGYVGRQSSQHRQREVRARGLQLELTAFSPFIESLSPEQKEEERVIMTRKTFGKTGSPSEEIHDPGPTATSFLMRRKRKEAEPGG